MSIKIQLPMGTKHTDEELAFIREMGVSFSNLNVMPDEATYENVMAVMERYAKYDIAVSDLACPPLQKNASIILGKPNRDVEIDKFIDFIELAAKVKVPIVSVAWQPNGIFRTGVAARPHTRGGRSAYADLKEIEARPVSNDREYGMEEIWGNFHYFLEKVIPVCEENGVRLALHPNDPPVKSLGGVASLIYNTETYRKAFALAKESPALGMKLCVGCWLEGGNQFGNLMQDIRTFCEQDKVLVVHFRNVSSTLPYFEETLSEDGYANMYEIMKQFVACGYQGYMSIDHAFKGYPEMGGMLGACAYPTGHMKGLLHAAEIETRWQNKV
ncbi:mannonate dehydratase [Scatolibacter rhodanostii]|uniref:mannonate dehydratase n=1 Tax=Scatolibacter rhodanostii TaxID=2014781 RepID=UPI0013566354|nr:mannonate dehydratase [Scatolibacter rhodanostii]